MLEPVFFGTLLAGTAAIAWRRGGRDGKIAAAALVGGAALSPVAQMRGFAGPEYGLVLVDLLLFLVLSALAFRSRAFWPLWAAGFQLGGLAVHLAAAQMQGMLPAAYAATLIIWSYPVLAAVALGAWFEGATGDPPQRRDHAR
jgi:hypothetical protein